MSPDTIANHLPGAPATLAGGEFGEASLNLARLAEIAFGKRCLGFESEIKRSCISRLPHGTTASQEPSVGLDPRVDRNAPPRSEANDADVHRGTTELVRAAVRDTRGHSADARRRRPIQERQAQSKGPGQARWPPRG